MRSNYMVNYKEAGVDVEEGYKAIDRYKIQARRTAIPGLLTDIGSFNGIFAVPQGMKDPVMVSGTDGVGTKLDIAFKLKKYDTVGIDCVAMSVNDILCSGCKTLFFLDYLACGGLDADVAGELVKGVADGCLDAGCALLGGETAEMPGFYDAGKYDLAGFGVGISEKSELITGEHIQENDVLIGLSSTGPHSNGYSLIRRLVTDFTEPFIVNGKDTGKTIGDVLLTPTRIYVRPVMDVLNSFRSSVHGMVHITGGGFYENIPRMYSKVSAGKTQLISVIKRGSWDVPPVFSELIRRGADPENVYSTFNMGIGFILAVNKNDADAIITQFNEHAHQFSAHGLPDMKAYKIGYVGHTDVPVEGELKGSHAMTVFES
jgi:phosphoribosylformylglycinamidine cyclo-ligase